MNINFEMGLNYFILIALLAIAGLLLKQWQPPIMKQYVCIALLIGGAILGYFITKNMLLGVVIAGLVFYKDEFVEEMKLIKDCVSDLKKDTDIDISKNK